eukprot:scaffold2640_cov180-Amphora_coffeaeformis.AAC.2
MVKSTNATNRLELSDNNRSIDPESESMKEKAQPPIIDLLINRCALSAISKVARKRYVNMEIPYSHPLFGQGDNFVASGHFGRVPLPILAARHGALLQAIGHTILLYV